MLVIGINYAPEHSGIAPYTTGLCEYLAAEGHDVHVVTGRPHYPDWKHPRDGALPEVNGGLNGVKVHRSSHYVPSKQSALRRGLYELSFLASAAASLVTLPKPDVIVGVVPALSGGVLARLAARRFGVPYVVIQQDLMGQAASQSGVSGGTAVARVTRAVEGWAARGASRVGIIAEGFHDYLLRAGVEPQRIARIRNWSFLPAATVQQADVRRSLGWPDDAVVCLHAGNMGFKQGLENFVDCATLARPNADLFFALIGDGSRRETLAARAKDLGLTNFSFGPTLDDQAYADALAAADILVLNQGATVRDMSFPSKLTSYLAAGRPIVAAVDSASEAGRELLAAGAGLVVTPGNSTALLEGVIRVAGDAKLSEDLVRGARSWLRRSFSRGAALQELESLITSTHAPRAPQSALSMR